ncbi:MAG: hypothetical protein JXA52_04400 [Planctomycetes bacterium]|nr:hypothetical protein [Planctomycetota bacterium]
MRLFKSKLGDNVLIKLRLFCLPSIILAAALLFSGCSTKEVLGKNSVDELSSQFTAYKQNQSTTVADTKRSVNAYIADEKAHFSDVVPQVNDYKARQGEDVSHLKITLRRWLDNR